MSPLIAQHHHGVLPHGTQELTTTVFQGLYVASRVTPHPQCPPAFLHRGRLLYIIHKCVHPFCGLFILLAYCVYSNIHFGSFFHFPFLILQIFYLFFNLFSGNFIVEYKILRSYLLPSLQLLGSSSQLHVFGFGYFSFGLAFETRVLCIALAGLELALQTRLASNAEICLLVSASLMLGLKVHVATPGFMYIFINPDTNYYGPFEHAYGAIHWRTGNLPGATPTEEN